MEAVVVKSKTDNDVELFYKKYSKTPVTEKYLCIIVKSLIDDSFIINSQLSNTYLILLDISESVT